MVREPPPSDVSTFGTRELATSDPFGDLVIKLRSRAVHAAFCERNGT
jgi:hypothetical protein